MRNFAPKSKICHELCQPLTSLKDVSVLFCTTGIPLPIIYVLVKFCFSLCSHDTHFLVRSIAHFVLCQNNQSICQDICKNFVSPFVFRSYRSDAMTSSGTSSFFLFVIQNAGLDFFLSPPG